MTRKMLELETPAPGAAREERERIERLNKETEKINEERRDLNREEGWPFGPPSRWTELQED